MQCQASKTLAFKWFHDWKKVKKIQPDKTYAQVLQLGKKVNQSGVNSTQMQNNFVTQQVSRVANVKQNSTKGKNKRLVQRQADQVKVLSARSNVAGFAKVSDVEKNCTKVQNRRLVQSQANQVKVLGSRSSVARVAEVSDSCAQYS